MDPVRLPRASPSTYRRITLLALLALCGIVLTGAAVRLTGSGLGCSDWPTCEEDRFVAPLEYHALVEFVNRTITGVVSIAVALAVLGSLRRTPRRRDLTWLSLGLVAGVVGQIVVGGITVLTHLRPEWVITHFLLSSYLVWNATVLHHRAARPDEQPGGPPAGSSDRAPDLLRRLATAVPVLAIVVIAAGTIVTGTGPHGGDPEVERLAFSIREVVRVHAVAALSLLALVGVLVAVVLRRPGGPRPAAEVPPGLLLRVEVLVGLLLAQIGVGYLQYFNGVPPLWVALHVALATAIWVVAVDVALTARDAVAGSVAPPAPPGEQDVPADDRGDGGGPDDGDRQPTLAPA